MSERFWVKLDRNRFYREIINLPDAERMPFVMRLALHLFCGHGESEWAQEMLLESGISGEKQHNAAKNAALARWDAERNAKGIPKRTSKSNAKGNASTVQYSTEDKEKKEQLTHGWFLDPKFSQAWKDWEKSRKEKAGEFQFKSLLKLSGGDMDSAILILEQSTGAGWKGLFELRATPKKQNLQILPPSHMRRLN